jgi:polysaccharide export outer membrane protein
MKNAICVSRKRTIAWMALLVALVTINGPTGAQTVKSYANGGANRDSGPSSSPGPTTTAEGSPYVIGPDDVLAVNVWKEPDLSRSVLVRPDGRITLPLLKDIEASGSTPGQLQARIEKGLSEYISEPSVTVIVQEAKSHKFNILGAVQKPGSYTLTGPMTVLDAIALAGGFREWAKMKNIYILRTGANGQQKLPFNYKQVISGKTADTQLRLRDTVVVP